MSDQQPNNVLAVDKQPSQSKSLQEIKITEAAECRTSASVASNNKPHINGHEQGKKPHINGQEESHKPHINGHEQDALKVQPQESKNKSRSLEEIHLTENPSASPMVSQQGPAYINMAHSPDLRSNRLAPLQVNLEQNGGTSSNSTSPRLRRSGEGGSVERSTTGSPFKRRIRRANSMGATMFTAAQDGQVQILPAGEQGPPTVMNDDFALQMTVLDEECK